jgi:hypothetical protein
LRQSRADSSSLLCVGEVELDRCLGARRPEGECFPPLLFLTTPIQRFAQYRRRRLNETREELGRITNSSQLGTSSSMCMGVISISWRRTRRVSCQSFATYQPISALDRHSDLRTKNQQRRRRKIQPTARPRLVAKSLRPRKEP